MRAPSRFRCCRSRPFDCVVRRHSHGRIPVNAPVREADQCTAGAAVLPTMEIDPVEAQTSPSDGLGELNALGRSPDGTILDVVTGESQTIVSFRRVRIS